MLRINVKDYKGALIQYTCEECLVSENFIVEFSDVPKVKPGGCVHFNINFLLVIEKYEIKYLLSFTCKNDNCQHNEMIELFNKNTTEEFGTIIYKCPKCGKGHMTAGFLLQKELIDLDENEEHVENIDNDENKKIKLIFSYDGKQYNVNVNKDILIPEAFHQLCEELNLKDLENLDIRNYLKGNEPLSQYSSIEELELKDGDIITIEVRGNIGWNAQ